MNFENTYRHRQSLQLRFSDIDRIGHVNNAIYHTYIELGRVHYLDEVLQRKVEWDKRGFVIARTEIDYKVPIYLRDKIFCGTRVSAMGSKSVTLESSIVKLKDGQYVECAAAVAVLVTMDYIKNESIPVPEEWRDLFKSYEKL